jgi:hypothetical protein
MVAEAEEEPAERAVRESFHGQCEAFYATFRDELEVAEAIDMFHLTNADWQPADVAVVAIAYVASVYRFWARKRPDAADAVARTVDGEMRRALAAVNGSGKGDELTSRIKDICNELYAIHERAAADEPLSRRQGEIVYLCAQLLKPESRHKAYNIALMPFLQIYVPERFSEILRLLDFGAGRARPLRASA